MVYGEVEDCADKNAADDSIDTAAKTILFIIKCKFNHQFYPVSGSVSVRRYKFVECVSVVRASHLQIVLVHAYLAELVVYEVRYVVCVVCAFGEHHLVVCQRA